MTRGLLVVFLLSRVVLWWGMTSVLYYTGLQTPQAEVARQVAAGEHIHIPTTDLPGYGVLWGLVGDWRPVSLGLELVGLWAWLRVVKRLRGAGAATMSGWVYLLAYPFVWPIVGHPMRDIAALPQAALWLSGGWAALAAGTALLWVRPMGAWLALPLAILTRRWRFVGALLVFMASLHVWNVSQYGTPNTYLLGRTLWETLGVVDNPHGFRMDDGAIVPWIKTRYGVDVEYGSVEMNRLAGRAAVEAVRADPWLWVRAAAWRARKIATSPLGLNNRIGGWYGRLFFWGGIGLALWRWRPGYALLLSPLAYALVVALGLHFEPRYMAMGAWTLCVPWAETLTRET